MFIVTRGPTMELQNKYIAYVNVYYAVQEALDSSRRRHEPEPEGLESFCRRANPFLWDEEASADRSVYEGFSQGFRERFDGDTSTAEDAYDFARDWLSSLEGDEFGVLLLDAFDSVTGREEFVRAFEPIRRQVELRRIVNEMMPQDVPQPPETLQDETVETPVAEGIARATEDDVASVASLLAPNDASRRADLEAYLHRQLSTSALRQWLYREGGSVVATAGLIPVCLPPTNTDGKTVGLLVLCAGPDDRLALLLDGIRSEEPDWEIQEGSLAV